MNYLFPETYPVVCDCHPPLRFYNIATNSFYVTSLHYTFIVNKANSKLYDIEGNGFILFVISHLIPNIVFST